MKIASKPDNATRPGISEGWYENSQTLQRRVTHENETSPEGTTERRPFRPGGTGKGISIAANRKGSGQTNRPRNPGGMV